MVERPVTSSNGPPKGGGPPWRTKAAAGMLWMAAAMDLASLIAHENGAATQAISAKVAALVLRRIAGSLGR